MSGRRTCVVSLIRIEDQEMLRYLGDRKRSFSEASRSQSQEVSTNSGHAQVRPPLPTEAPPLPLQPPPPPLQPPPPPPPPLQPPPPPPPNSLLLPLVTPPLPTLRLTPLATQPLSIPFPSIPVPPRSSDPGPSKQPRTKNEAPSESREQKPNINNIAVNVAPEPRPRSPVIVEEEVLRIPNAYSDVSEDDGIDLTDDIDDEAEPFPRHNDNEEVERLSSPSHTSDANRLLAQGGSKTLVTDMVRTFAAALQCGIDHLATVNSTSQSGGSQGSERQCLNSATQNNPTPRDPTPKQGQASSSGSFRLPDRPRSRRQSVHQPEEPMNIAVRRQIQESRGATVSGHVPEHHSNRLPETSRNRVRNIEELQAPREESSHRVASRRNSIQTPEPSDFHLRESNPSRIGRISRQGSPINTNSSRYRVLEMHRSSRAPDGRQSVVSNRSRASYSRPSSRNCSFVHRQDVNCRENVNHSHRDMPSVPRLDRCRGYTLDDIAVDQLPNYTQISSAAQPPWNFFDNGPQPHMNWNTNPFASRAAMTPFPNARSLSRRSISMVWTPGSAVSEDEMRPPQTPRYDCPSVQQNGPMGPPTRSINEAIMRPTQTPRYNFEPVQQNITTMGPPPTMHTPAKCNACGRIFKNKLGVKIHQRRCKELFVLTPTSKYHDFFNNNDDDSD